MVESHYKSAVKPARVFTEAVAAAFDQPASWLRSTAFSLENAHVHRRQFAIRVANVSGSINLRVATSACQLVGEAAAIIGETRTDFMVESATRDATDVLLDGRLIMLDPDQHDAFLRALENPPPPDAKLKALMHRVPAWKS